MKARPIVNRLSELEWLQEVVAEPEGVPVKTMAEVIADVLAAHSNLEWSFEYGGFVCVECGWQETYARPYAQEAQTEARSNHQATALSAALSAAGYGPVKAVAVVHVAHDTEAHAQSFNEGYETAMAQELAEDPTTAQDWLDEKLANAKAEGWDECEVAPYEIRLEPGGKFWQPYKDNPYRSAE